MPADKWDLKRRFNKTEIKYSQKGAADIKTMKLRINVHALVASSSTNGIHLKIKGQLVIN